MTSRSVTDESMITWRTDDPNNVSLVDTSVNGRIKFLSPTSPLGNRSVVTRSTNLSPLAVSFGDFNPWSGDWSEVIGGTNHERRLAAPTSVYWCTPQSVDVTNVANGSFLDLLSMYREISSYLTAVKAGSIYGNAVGAGNEITIAQLFDPTTSTSGWATVYDAANNNADIGPWLPFPVIMDSLESMLTDQDGLQHYQGDRARVKVSANPYGGDTHGQLNKVHTNLQTASSSTTNSPMGLYNYTEITSLPIFGSTDVITIDGGLNIMDNIFAWDIDVWTNPESSEVDDYMIAAPDAAIGAFLNPDGTIDNISKLAFPLFVNQDATTGGNHGTLSFYQPHLCVGGDGYSAKVLMAAGGTSFANGFMSSGMVNDMCITSAGLQIGLPDATAEHQFWIDGTKLGHRGSYGIEDGDRPWHNAVIEANSSIAYSYRASKTEGDGNFSISQFGYAYNNVPLVDSDWVIMTYHFNPKLKSCVCQAYSLANAVFHTGTEIGLEVTSFTQPFTSFQWEDIGGKGATSQHSIDLKGYKYKYENTDLTVPKGARVDSRKAAGGHKMTSLTMIPLVREKVKMWVSRLNANGITTELGRFDAVSANDTGLTETIGGPLFTVRPTVSSNIYYHWTATKSTDVIGRSTLKVL